MYHAAGREVAGRCAERPINLLQLVDTARKVRGEDSVRQLADTRREPIVCTPSEPFGVPEESL